MSKGLIGEDNAAILGSFLVTKIQLAAMSRSDIPDIRDRRPFYLYVDEFQNFATDSFATILSEARKYGLNLTVANQYISQMNETVRDAVFGNVGTMISFRVSADDAPILAKQFEPNFEAVDLLQMHNRNFVINMVIGGEKTPAFSARTLELPPSQADNTPHIIEHSRRMYSRNREDVEREINAAIMPNHRPKNQPQAVAAAALAQPVKKAASQPAQKTNAAANTQLATPQTATNSGEVILQIRGNNTLDKPADSTDPAAATTPKKRRRRRKKSTV